jgi:hypothetical protein
MGLYYETQPTQVLIGTKTEAGTRTGVALTGSYQAEGAGAPTRTIKTGLYSKINLDILYTMGAAETGNSIEIIAEGSPDNVNFYRLPNDNTSGATSTLTARQFTFTGADAAATTISIGLDIFYKWMRFSFREAGVVTNAGSVFVESTLSGK